MTNYKEILRLDSLGISQRSIAKSCECSRNTVASTLTRAKLCGVSWPLPNKMTDAELFKNLFTEKAVPSSRKKEGSRFSTFIDEEKCALLPLPAIPYELATWKIVTVQFNYHISIDKMHYSIPYEYIKQKVDIRITRNIIEVFFNNNRICSHPRLYGREG